MMITFHKVALLLILTLILEIKGQEQQKKKPSGSFDDLVSSVWNNEPKDNKANNLNQPIRGASLYEKCGENKICVPFYNCRNDTDEVNTDGENLIDIRFDDTRPCATYLERCCSIANNQGGIGGNGGSNGAGGSSGNEGNTGNTGGINGIGGSSGTGILPKPNENKQGCGHRNAGGILFRITGNKAGETEYAEFPWMVAILEQEIAGDEILNIYKCGGSIIHPNVVLTAAHCVEKSFADKLIVRAGEWDTQTKDEPHEEQDRLVIEIIVHEKFSNRNLFNDIALLFTAQSFVFASNVNSVCLPPLNFNFNGNRCFATGWGKDKFGQTGQYQVILKKIELPIVSNDECQTNLRESRLGRFFQLHESFICAGGEIDKDACKGDGGGPLSCPIPGQQDRFYQSGIVAWGIGCGTSHPGVYGNVAFFRNWIDNTMSSRGYDTSYYTESLSVN